MVHYVHIHGQMRRSYLRTVRRKPMLQTCEEHSTTATLRGHARVPVEKLRR